MSDAPTITRTGTVVRYEPDPSRFEPRWCREGIAVADSHGRLVDTFWEGGSEAHVLTAEEVATATHLFDLSDYRELPHAERYLWKNYHPDERQRITSQHGLSARYFVRLGAEPDLGTRVENARLAVREAEEAVKSAQSTLAWRRRELDALTTPAPPAAPRPDGE